MKNGVTCEEGYSSNKDKRSSDQGSIVEVKKILEEEPEQFPEELVVGMKDRKSRRNPRILVQTSDLQPLVVIA